MSWKNIIENSIQLILVFVGLGIYTSMVLEPIIVEALRTETTKIENNIKTEIDNKFKKVDKVISEMPLSIEPKSTQSMKEDVSTIDCAITVSDFNKLSDSRKRRLKGWIE